MRKSRESKNTGTSATKGKTILSSYCNCPRCRAMRSSQSIDPATRRAMGLAGCGFIDEAVESLIGRNQASRHARKRVAAARTIAESYERHDLTLRIIDRIAELDPKRDTRLQRIRALEETHDHEQVRSLIEGMEIRNNSQRNAIAHSLSHIGDMEPAVRMARQVATERGKAADWHGLSAMVALTPDEIATVEHMLQAERLDKSDKAMVLFTLAREYERNGLYEKAIGNFHLGNDIVRAMLPAYDHLQTARSRHAAIKSYDREAFDGTGHPSKTPIFIVGMYRGGSTLTESIISAHPRAKALGETNAFMRAVRQGLKEHGGDEGGNGAFSTFYHSQIATLSGEVLRRIGEIYLEQTAKTIGADPNDPDLRTVNKLSANVWQAGLIHKVFPNAKLVHTGRDPMDNCLSLYSYLFSMSERAPDYCWSLEHLGLYYREMRTMVDHWRKVLPDSAWIESDYESLTADPESHIPRLIASLGLPWDEACLHPENNKKTVHTVSFAQVRKPIYRSSVKKAERYGDLLSSLREAIDRPIVAIADDTPEEPICSVSRAPGYRPTIRLSADISTVATAQGYAAASFGALAKGLAAAALAVQVIGAPIAANAANEPKEKPAKVSMLGARMRGAATSYQWVASGYSACSPAAANPSYKTQTVQCELGGVVEPNSKCKASLKPLTKATCNCPVTSKTSTVEREFRHKHCTTVVGAPHQKCGATKQCCGVYYTYKTIIKHTKLCGHLSRPSTAHTKSCVNVTFPSRESFPHCSCTYHFCVTTTPKHQSCTFTTTTRPVKVVGKHTKTCH